MEGDGKAVLSQPHSGVAVTLQNKENQLTIKRLDNRNLQHTTGRNIDNDNRRETHKIQCDNGVQVADGRYTTTYKMMYCHVCPTSPAEEVSEFPPRRASVDPGYGNFEIGAGNRQTNNHPTRRGSLRSGLYRADKAFQEHMSFQCNSFAGSLRKYPSLSPERSSELVEKLMNYNQTRPSRYRNASLPNDINTFEQQLLDIGRRSPNNNSVRGPVNDYIHHQLGHLHVSSLTINNSEPLVAQYLSTYRYDESPTREKPKIYHVARETWRRPAFTTTGNDRDFQHITKRIGKDKYSPMNSNNLVNMKIQVAVEMESKEIDAMPDPRPVQEIVAAPPCLSPSIPGNEMQVNVLHTPAKKDEESQAVQCILQANMKIQTEIEKLKTEDFTLLINDLHIPTSDSTDEVKQKCTRRSYSDNQINTKKIIELSYNNVVFDMNKDSVSHNDLILSEVKNMKKHKRDKSNENLKVAIERWLSILLIKRGCHVDSFEKDFIFQYIYKRLKVLKNHNYVLDNRNKFMLRSNINKSLFKDKSKTDMILIIGKLTDLLLKKIRSIYKKKQRNHIDVRKHNNKVLSTLESEQDTEKEIKRIISTNLHSLLRNIDISYLIQHQIHDMKNKLLDAFQIFKSTKDCDLLRSNIKHSLKVNGLQEKDIINISEELFNKLITEINKDYKLIPPKPSHSIILPVIQFRSELSRYKISQKDLTKKPIENNYLTSLSFTKTKQAVGDWLNSLDLPPQLKYSKNTLINNLTVDIHERQTDLYLNRLSNVYNKIELDHLRYQIFKWNYKYFNDQYIIPLDKVENLFNHIQRLQSCRKEKFLYEENLDIDNNMKKVGISRVFYDGNQNMTYIPGDKNQNTTDHLILNQVTISQQQEEIRNLQTNLKNEASRQLLYKNYIQFVKDWVKKIPIDTTLGREKISDHARQNIQNDVWKRITRLNFDPSIFSYQFLYENLLENEIDEIFACFPQTTQLIVKRHFLKVHLIEKTITAMKSVYNSTQLSLTNKLIQKILAHFQDLKLIDIDILNIKSCVLNFAENFILLTKYANKDQAKANLYSKKKSKDIEILFNILRKTHSSILNTYDISSFQNNLIKELESINLTEKALNEEADKILLGVEIDEWFVDLPSIKTFEDENQRRVLRDILAIQIKEIDNNIHIKENNKTTKLKTEICKFLEELLLQKEKKTYIKEEIKFLANELLNRINNMRRAHQILIEYNNIASLNVTKNFPGTKLRFKETYTSDSFDSTLNPKDNIKGHTLLKPIHYANTFNQVYSVKTQLNFLHDEQDNQIISQAKPVTNLNIKTDHKTLVVNKRSENKNNLRNSSDYRQDDGITDCKVKEKEIPHSDLFNNVNIKNKFNSDIVSNFNTNKLIKERTNKDILKSCAGECQTNIVTALHEESNINPLLCSNENDKDIDRRFNIQCKTESSTSNRNCFSNNSGLNEDYPCIHRFRNFTKRTHSHNENYTYPFLVPMFYAYPCCL